MSKSTYIRRKAQGLCVKCGKQAADGRVMCAECAEKQRIYRKENREFFKSMGLCPRCGKNKLFGEEKECPECLAMMYEINKRSKERRNITSSDYFKKYYQQAKESGLCCDCRKRKAVEGHVYCQNCREKRKELGKIYRRSKDNNALERSERPDYGLCYTCGNPLDRDGRICKKCAEKMTKNLPSQRDNILWRNDNKLIFKQ